MDGNANRSVCEDGKYDEFVYKITTYPVLEALVSEFNIVKTLVK